MDWRIYGIIIFLGLFVLILILNPKLSCFGKRIKSPLYPLFRKRKQKLKTHDYGFSLVDDTIKQKSKEKKPEDFGVHSESKVDSD